jgi:hypothetical protein
MSQRPCDAGPGPLAPADVAELLARPLGNHPVLVPGLVAGRLRDYRDWLVAP